MLHKCQRLGPATTWLLAIHTNQRYSCLGCLHYGSSDCDPTGDWGMESTRPIFCPNRFCCFSDAVFKSNYLHQWWTNRKPFHIFGSIAFLAAYRDWRVIIVATTVAATDHLARGMFWPMSIFGVDQFALMRSLEHATWVIFEDIFILIATYHAVVEMRVAAKLDVMSRVEQQNAMRTELNKLRGAISAGANGDSTVDIDDSSNEGTPL